MNNNVKFRLYDVEEKIMYYPQDIERIDFSDGYARVETKSMGGYYDLTNKEECILLQSTGILDSLGITIYDGDILSKDGYFSVRVEYDKASFMVRDLDEVRYNNRILNAHLGEFDLDGWVITGSVYKIE